MPREQSPPGLSSAPKARARRVLRQRPGKIIPAETKPDEILGIRDVATLLKIKTRVLRAHLRKITCKAPGQRYAWKASDPCLRSLRALIKTEEAKEAKRAGTATSSRPAPAYPAASDVSLAA